MGHQMGDCRAQLGDVITGQLKRSHRAVVDGFFPAEVRNLGYGFVQTPIHAMTGAAVWRDGVSEEDRRLGVKCTRESMSRMKIDGDDGDEAVHAEWMAFNMLRCSSLAKKHQDETALLPFHASGGWRLATCGTQPTRGICGSRETLLKKGQTFRYDVPSSGRNGHILAFGCDGVEDHNAIPKSKIVEVSTSVDCFKALFDDDNLLFKFIQEYETSYPKEGTFCEKLSWMETHAKNIPVDNFWKDSIQKSASELKSLFMDEDLSFCVRAFILLCSVRASSDNVTFGLIKYI